MVKRSRRRKLGSIVLAGYLLFLHAALVVAIVRPYRVMAFVQQLREAFDPGWRPSEFWSGMVGAQARLDASAAGSVLFLGDSGFQSLNVNLVAGNIVNYGIGGDTIEGLRHRLPLYRSLAQAKAAVLSIGSNDLTSGNAVNVASSYAQLVASIDAKIPLVVSAVLPIDERSLGNPSGFRNNKEIRALNAAIARICAARTSCVYADPSQMLVDETGNLRPDYQVGDGLHLTGDGNRIWAGVLRSALKKVGAI